LQGLFGFTRKLAREFSVSTPSPTTFGIHAC
jgi:hypothetical protein